MGDPQLPSAAAQHKSGTDGLWARLDDILGKLRKRNREMRAKIVCNVLRGILTDYWHQWQRNRVANFEVSDVRRNRGGIS